MGNAPPIHGKPAVMEMISKFFEARSVGHVHYPEAIWMVDSLRDTGDEELDRCGKKIIVQGKTAFERLDQTRSEPLPFVVVYSMSSLSPPIIKEYLIYADASGIIPESSLAVLDPTAAGSDDLSELTLDYGAPTVGLNTSTGDASSTSSVPSSSSSSALNESNNSILISNYNNAALEISSSLSPSSSSSPLSSSSSPATTRSLRGGATTFFSGLLSRVMNSILINSGAKSGALILLDEDKQLHIEAMATLIESNDNSGSTTTTTESTTPTTPRVQVRILRSNVEQGSAWVCRSMVMYAHVTGNTAWLDDAGGLFLKDTYIKERGIQSALVLPLLHHGGVAIGYVYLEV